MSEGTGRQNVVRARRSLLAIGSGLAGMATARHWAKPVVESAILPVHAQTTAPSDGPSESPPEIFNLRVTGGECIGEPVAFRFFNIEYDFSSLFGIVAHVVTADCEAGDTLEIVDGNRNLGDNLLDDFSNNAGSVILTGDEFSGSADITLNSINGTDPFNCGITVTLTDANGGQVSDTVVVSEACEAG